MWPFKKKDVPPPPDDVIVGDIVASYDASLEEWQFEVDGMDFTLSGLEFDPVTVTWARQAASDIKGLQDEIDGHVLKNLEGWPCNTSARYLLSASLDDYAESKTVDVAFAGDGSWGDYGVNVIIEDGKIIDSHGGD